MRRPPRGSRVVVDVWIVLSVFSEATSTLIEIGANSSFAVYWPFWPWVSAQKTIFRIAAAFADCCRRMMYVKVQIGYAAGFAFDGFTM